MEIANDFKVVDLDKVIKQSDSKLLKSLPKFAVNKIKKIIKQEELNTLYLRHKEKSGIEFVNGLLQDFNINLKIEGTENLPKDGKFVFVANHPLGGIDALAYLSAIEKFFGKVISPSNELFMYVPNLHPLIVGINVFGRNTKEKISKMNEAFESDVQIMIFPAGEVSRKINGKIIDVQWQKTFITKSIQFKRDVIPAFISGQNTSFFYNLAKIRKNIGIKSYLETFYLPDEMFKKQNTTLVIRFGNPIPYQTFDNSKPQSEWAQYVNNMVYSMKPPRN